MINIDTRLLDLLNGSELAVFMHILKRINKTNESFPSRRLLQEETGFGRDKLAQSIKGLLNKNILKTYQAKDEIGKFAKTIYVIKTDLASIYMPAKDEQLDTNEYKPLTRDTENRYTETPQAGKQHLSINHKLSINQYKGKPHLFYENEIKNNSEKTEISNYKKFYSLLCGANTDEGELSGLLSMPKQVSYKSFVGLIQKSRNKKRKFTGILNTMSNDKKYFSKISLSKTIHTWLDKDFK